MITESMIYWITRLDHFSGFTFGVGMVLTLLGGFALSISISELIDGTEIKWLVKTLAVVVLIGIINLVGSLFIPTMKEMCAIKVLPLVVNDEQVQELPSKFVDLADEWLKELKPNSLDKSEQKGD